jgi:hypothetical protein
VEVNKIVGYGAVGYLESVETVKHRITVPSETTT